MAHDKLDRELEKKITARVAQAKRRDRKERQRREEVLRGYSSQADTKLRDYKGNNFPALLKRVDADGAERLMWLLEALRKAEAARLELFQLEDLREKQKQPGPLNHLYLLGGNPVPKIDTLRTELQALKDKINEALSYYRFTPAIDIPASYDQLASSDNFIHKTEAFGFECMGVKWLVELATNGVERSHADILKFRNCQKCGELFYSAKDGSYCSQRCYQRVYYSQPSYKKKRNAKMRKERRDDRDAEQDFFKKEGKQRLNRHSTNRSKRRMIQ